jgi:hypothetical protein
VCAKNKTATGTLRARKRIFIFGRISYKRPTGNVDIQYEIARLANRLMAKSLTPAATAMEEFVFMSTRA